MVAIQLETPTGILLGRWDTGSPEWHAARANGLGGSEIAAVLGLSPFESRFSLWHRKAGQLASQAESAEMEWGKRLEPAIAQKFTENHSDLAPIASGTWCHTGRPWQIANPDLLLGERCGCDLICECGIEPTAASLLEIKVALYDDEWGPSGSDEIPPGYRAQVQWYMDVFGLPHAHVAVFLCGSFDYREYVIPADPDDQVLMRERAQEFLDSIRLGRRPDIDSHSATYQAVRELHPLIDPEDVEIGADLAGDYGNACAAYIIAKADKQETVSRVLDAMGNARRATCDGRPVAIRVAQRPGALPHLRPARNGKAPS